jgi:methylmalonyl-CoA mutase cobalamin-binding subunit
LLLRLAHQTKKRLEEEGVGGILLIGDNTNEVVNVITNRLVEMDKAPTFVSNK